MNSRLVFFPLVICTAVFFLVCITGCRNTILSGPRLRENPAANPQSPVSENPAWYVSVNGKTSGRDPARSVASVQGALDSIRSLYRKGKWPAGKSAVIVISGTITGSGSFGPNRSMIDISGAGNYPPIILEGDPMNAGVLNANRNRNNEGRVLYIANNKVTLGSNLTLTGGYSLWGGAVCVGTAGSASDGEFIITGGEISGNTAGLGGGVLVYKGAMTMTGGVIKNNINTDSYSGVKGSGAGVYLYEYNSFTMNGGTISGNGGAATENGGGVLADGHAVFTMSGGEILRNTSSLHGGGVHVGPYGKFVMTGGTISGNSSAEAGGVYTSPYKAVFTQSGGTVSGNTPAP
ncbi:MAG: hypothetical protein LBC62_02895 [Treponema sp.]|nr:hypothetical protein [Treponema sp.]